MSRYRLPVIFTILVTVISCVIFLFLRNSPYKLYQALGKTGNATQLFDKASLIVIPFPSNRAQEIPGVTYQAIGVLVPQNQNYFLKPLTNGPSVTIRNSRPIFVSADRKYLKIGSQIVRLGDWAMVGQSEEEWEPLRDDVNTSMSAPSRDNQYYFYISTNRGGFRLWVGDWFLDIAKTHGEQKTLFLGLGKVQQAGWAPDQQSIYINNDGRILNMPLK